MKTILTTIILSFPIFLLGQYQQEIRPVTDEVIQIEQTNYNGLFKKSGWKSIYEYENGKIQRIRNWYKNDLRLDERYRYEVKGNEVVQIKTDRKGREYVTVDSISGQLQKRAIYLSTDSNHPSSVLHSFEYNSQNKLTAYKRTSKGYNGSQATNCTEINYFENKMVIQEKVNCDSINKTITIEYDQKGNPVFETIDHHDTTAVITGGRSEKGMQRYKYLYDKNGNWIKRYYVTSEGRSILEIKRGIKYK